MARVGVLTFHRASNYGAVLQAYALQEVLRDLGHASEVIDYRSEFIEAHYSPSVWATLASPRKLGIALLRNGYMRDRRSLFSDFTARFVPLSPQVSAGELREFAKRYDVLIAGSDQVWNHQTAGFDQNFFLGFAPAGVRKVGYAASIGVPRIPEHLREDYRRLLAGFRGIAMREETGAAALEPILGFTPESVLDPTLLLDRKRWVSTFGAQGGRQPYILMYLLSEAPEIVDYARKLSRKTGLRVRYVSQRLFRLRGVTTLDALRPEDFVREFAGAAAVVTNSFHGIAFALNFGLDLHYDLLPPPSAVNSRITDLARRFGLEERRIGDGLLEERSTASVERAEEQLESERLRSIKLLSGMVEDL